MLFLNRRVGINCRRSAAILGRRSAPRRAPYRLAAAVRCCCEFDRQWVAFVLVFPVSLLNETIQIAHFLCIAIGQMCPDFSPAAHTHRQKPQLHVQMVLGHVLHYFTCLYTCC
jgi:hypothetical protein